MSPGLANYPYNLLTGYHYKPPFGLDVPEGRYFNPYYDHMIIAMPPQLHDGMIEYDDGGPSRRRVYHLSRLVQGTRHQGCHQHDGLCFTHDVSYLVPVHQVPLHQHLLSQTRVVRCQEWWLQEIPREGLQNPQVSR